VKDVERFDVVIIGGGVAGFSAALYVARQGLKVCVITTDIGGQLSYASLIENYPGFDAAPGINLVLKIQQQAVSLGTEVFIDEVEHIEKKGDVFVVKTRSGTVFEALAIIAACGKARRRLEVSEEEKYVGKGLSYCVICDAAFFKGKKVALVSFGERGIESLNILSPLANEVLYIVPYWGDPSIRQAKLYSNVRIFEGCRVTKLFGEKKLEKVFVKCNDEKEIEVEVAALFVEMGFETRVDFLKRLVDFNEKGEIIVNELGATRTLGLFAAGDLASNTPYKQAIIAAASGVIAALSAINYVIKVKGLRREVRADWEKKLAGVGTGRRFRL